MSPVKKFFVTLSILTSLGGAVNSGWSYFGIAVPFMVYLLIVAYHLKKSVFVGTIVFVVLCIITSLTRDHNPLIYPILSNGEVTVLQDGYHVGWNDGSGGFSTEQEIKHLVDYTDEVGAKKINELVSLSDKKSVEILDRNAFYKGSKITITKLKKGDTFKVTGIKHSYADSHSSIAIVTPIGQFGSYNDNPFGPYKSDTEMKAFLKTNKPVQSMPLSALSIFPLLLIVNPLIFFLVFGVAYLVLTLFILAAQKIYKATQPGADQATGSTKAPKDAETEAPGAKEEAAGEEKK